jgi:hypothetical protein
VRRLGAFGAIAAVVLLAACSNAGQPFNTPNAAPVCIAAAGLQARLLDLRALDPATATKEDVQAAAYGVYGAWQTLEAQARVNAENEAVQFGLTAKALQDSYNALPEGTSPQDAATQLQPQIQAVQSSWTTLNSKLGCPEMTPAPA